MWRNWYTRTSQKRMSQDLGVRTALQSIEPSTISLGAAAQLTITSIGSEMPAITPPMVPGLEFIAVGQSQQVQIINGVTSSRTTVTYQVIPQQAGVFSIPSALPGAEPVVLTVNRGTGSAPGGQAAPGGTAQGAQTQPSSSLPADTTRQGASGAAFVRLRLSKHELYVGEMVPVDIQVGARDGMVASLNGPPTLNGDAFTLSKLPENPTRTEEVVDGKPFIVFTWHTALVAVKPGTLSLTMDTPLTVRVTTPGRPGGGFFGGSGFRIFSTILRFRISSAPPRSGTSPSRALRRPSPCCLCPTRGVRRTSAVLIILETRKI